MRRTIRVGSRESALAVAQAEIIIDLIKAVHPELSFELVKMKTSGDVNMKPFADVTDTYGIKGLFTRELEDALYDGRLDFAVHSLKDMPLVRNKELPIVALSAREDARDALILPGDGRLGMNRPIGCSSARRRLQMKRLYPGCEIAPVRGNVLTRLDKLDRGEYSALVLAAAGLRRLGLERRISRLLGPEEMIPAAGQGILACQGRAGEDYGYLDAVRDKTSEICAAAERAFSAALGGGCTSPVASYAELAKGRLFLRGFYADEDEGVSLYCCTEGSPADAKRLGAELALSLKREKQVCGV